MSSKETYNPYLTSDNLKNRWEKIFLNIDSGLIKSMSNKSRR